MKHLDAQSCYADLAAAPMKRFFRVRDGIALLLVALGTMLSYRAAFTGARLVGYARPDVHLRYEFGASSEAPSSINSTLLRLASLDVGEVDLRKEIEELIDGTFAASDPRYRSIAAWRRISYIEERLQRLRSSKTISPTSLLHPKARNVYPEFRRVLRDWSRRRRFQPDIISELVDLVKRPLDRHYAGGRMDASATQRYGSCAVVGNSGILMMKERGDQIDEHDLVIRLNNAGILGYKKNVGSKTGLSFVNSNILHRCARRDSCFCHPYGENVPIIMYICQAVHFVDYTICNASHKAPLLVTDPRFDLLCARLVKYYSLRRFVALTGKAPEEWEKVHDAKDFHYSSGMQAVLLAVGICNRVSIFGFGKSAEARHHYHTNQKAELSLHDYEAEYALYRDLIERPQAIPFLGESGFRVPEVAAYD